MLAFRALCPEGTRCLVALSAGADSSALLLALAAGLGTARATRLVACHVVHDLRGPDATAADAAAAQALCDRLAIPLVLREVRVRAASVQPRNLEAAARAARYHALAQAAQQHHCQTIATAHHAHDNLETILIALLRGCGPAPLGGLRPSRPLTPQTASQPAPSVRIIRPMLTCTPQQARELCQRCGWTWQEDATNTDTTRLRAALRASALPALLALPTLATPSQRQALFERLVWQGELARHAGALASARARRAPRVQTPTAIRWDRATLKALGPAPLAAALLDAARTLSGPSGRDRLGRRHLGPALKAIRSPATQPKLFRWHALTLRVTSRTVELALTSTPAR
jgi:tRNA(Ile)-lysidine synthetase-like protein